MTGGGSPRQTYKNLPDWYKELREYRPGIPVVCIANKIDVDMKVTQKEFGFPKKHNLQVRAVVERATLRMPPRMPFRMPSRATQQPHAPPPSHFAG